MTDKQLGSNRDGTLQILMVEDNPADVLLLREALNEVDLRYHLSHVSEGKKAANYLHQRREYRPTSTPDLVLLDLNLPKRTGWEVFDEIRSEDHMREIPVVDFLFRQP